MRPLAVAASVLSLFAVVGLLIVPSWEPVGRFAASEAARGVGALPPPEADVASYDPELAEAWVRSYTEAGDRRAEMLAEGVRLFAGRREWVAQLIQRDPEGALQQAFSYQQRADLPPSIIELFEEPISSGAAFEVELACGLDSGRSEMRRFVQLDDGRRLPAFTYGRRLEVPCKDRISVHGVAANGLVAIHAEPLRSISEFEVEDRGLTGGEVFVEALGDVVAFRDRGEVERLTAALADEETRLGPWSRAAYLELEGSGGSGDAAAPREAESAWTEGDKTLLYLRVQFSDDDPATEDLSYETARSRQDDVEEFLKINSYGKSLWTTTITDSIRLENSYDYYKTEGWSTMMNDARALAVPLGQAQGEDWDYQSFDFYTVVSRGGIGSYAGVAQVGGRRSHLQSTSLRTAGHEFGHNLGLSHANYHYSKGLSPRSAITYEGLSNVEYGHRFSIMSAQSGSDFNNPALPHFTAHEKWRLDWLTDADILDITDSSANGVHRVYQNDLENAAGLRALRLPSGGELSKYWVSYRAAWTAANRSSAQDFLLNGAVFDWTGSGGGKSRMLDMTPYTDDGSHSGASWTRDNRDKWDAPLAIGRTYSDRAAGVHVTPIARGGAAPDEYLDVFVHVDGAEPVELVRETDPCRAIVPDAATAAGRGWTEIGFDDSGWTSGTLGVGYERNSGYGGFIGTDLEGGMYNQHESAYIRASFEIASAAELDLVGLALDLRYDDGFVAYLNGVQFAEANAPSAPAWDSGATSNHSDSAADDFQRFDASSVIGELVVGTNVLAIHGLNDGAGSSDFLIQPRLVATPSSGSNAAPTVELAASSLSTSTGGQIDFAATGADAEGDTLAYSWHFDQGDEFVAEGQNSPTATKSWSSPGQYVVRVICSDRKGGVADDFVVVTVGEPNSDRQIHGRVLKGGVPFAGARVWAGGEQTVSGSDGRYALVGLGAGTHEVQAQADGEVFTFSQPNPVSPDPVLWGADFWAHGRADEAGEVLTVSPGRAVVELGGSLDLDAWLWDNAAVADEQLVAFGAGWRYLDDGGDPGAAWQELAFDDSSWGDGPAPLGFGEGDEATVVSFGGDANNVHTTTYFRHVFNVADLASISRVQLRLQRDDGIVIYLNGAELLRENITTGSISPSTEANNEVSGTAEEEILSFGLDSDLLIEGANQLAVEIHQEASDSGDLRFDLELTAARNLSAVTPTWSVDTGASIDVDGLFTASSPGSYTVTAELAGLVASAEITVPSGMLVAIETIDGVASEYGGDGGVLRVTRSASLGDLDVPLNFSGNADIGVDVASIPAVVTIPDGQSSVDLILAAEDDAEVEGVETVTVSVAESPLYSVGSPGSGSVGIEDDDYSDMPMLTMPPDVTTAVGVPVALEAQASNRRSLIARGAAWRYLDDGSDPGAAWRANAFDAAAWRGGFGALGYGDGDETTVVEQGGDPLAITTYFRKAFRVGDPNEWLGLTLELQRDDGAIVFLNDQELLRDNMPAGAVSSSTPAAGTVGGDDEDAYFSSELTATSLVAGENVIAVEIHQASTSSSDISFDLALAGTTIPALQWEKVAGPGGVDFSDPVSSAPEVSFNQPGEYEIRLSAGSGGGQVSDTVRVIVVPYDFAWWVASYPELNDATAIGDPDGDGRSNLFEFAVVGDPQDADIDTDPTADVEFAPEDAILFSYRRRPGGAGPTGNGYNVAGIRYIVEVATRLGDWQPAADVLTVEEVGLPADEGDGAERVTLRLATGSAEPASARWFVRLTVEETP